jgi:outer membrane biosynthesis protein TonB
MTTTTPVSTPDTAQPTPSNADRVQNGVLVAIVLLVGLMAGAASFSHVHDWTLANSPAGTPDWFGWANAVISELIPTASLIEIGRRRRRDTGASVRYPMVLLVAAVGVSLTAQLAVARPSAFGWMVSALPALAFFALSKLVFTATAPPRPSTPVTAATPATSPAPSADTTQVEVRPAAAPTKTRATTTAKKATPAKKTPARTPAQKTTAPAAPQPVPAAPELANATTPDAPSARFSAPLLSNARTIAASHREQHSEDINPNQMAVRLRVPTPIATDILTALATNPPAAATTRPHNGSTIAGVTA